MRVDCGGVHSGAVLLEAMLPSVGKGRAVPWSSSFTCAGVRVRSSDRARAATPATRGDAKLVPTEALKLSVYAEAAGAVVPELVLVRMGYRHGALGAVLTQLPPGALIANHAIHRKDALEDEGEQPNPIVDFVALLPRRLGYNLGP